MSTELLRCVPSCLPLVFLACFGNLGFELLCQFLCPPPAEGTHAGSVPEGDRDTQEGPGQQGILLPINSQDCDPAWEGLGRQREGPQGECTGRQLMASCSLPQLFEQSEWQPTHIDGKGYLLNEPGTQLSSVYGDFSCKEEPDIDSPRGKRLLGPYRFWEKGEANGGRARAR